MPQEEHQLGDGTFGGAVIAADDACLKQLEAGFVAAHLYRTAGALGDVDDDDVAFGGFLQLLYEPVFLRGVARAVGFQYHCFQVGDVKYGVYDAFLYAGEEGKHHHVGVKQVVGFHRTGGVGATDEVLVVADVDACFGQRGIIEGAEGVEILGIYLGGPVAPHQFVFEEDADFGYHGRTVGTAGGGNFDGGDEVLLAVRAQGADGQLRAGQDDRLAQVFQHEAQGRGGIGHGVCAVQDDKAVEALVVIVYDFDYLGPHQRLHVRRIDGRVELVGADVVVEPFQFGHMAKQVVEVEVLQRTGLRILYHADGSACVNKKDGRIVVCHNFEELMFFGYKSKEKDRDTLYISAYFIADASKDKGKSLSTPRIS